MADQGKGGSVMAVEHVSDGPGENLIATVGSNQSSLIDDLVRGISSNSPERKAKID